MAAMQMTFSNGWGGGISSHNATITLEDVLFDQCVSGESGGAIQTAMSNVTINRMTCRDTSSSVRPINTLLLETGDMLLLSGHLAGVTIVR